MGSAGGEAKPGRLDHLLAQEQMVADPRISAAQAAKVLNLTVAQVYRLMRLGRLQSHGPPGTSWQLLLSEVERYRDRGEAIAVKEAAKLLRCTPDEVRDLMANGRLTAVDGARRPVYLGEVQALAVDRGIEPRRPPRRRRRPPPQGYVTSPTAAKALGRSVSGVRSLAARGVIPSTRDEFGIYCSTWFTSKWSAARGTSPRRISAARTSTRANRSADAYIGHQLERKSHSKALKPGTWRHNGSSGRRLARCALTDDGLRCVPLAFVHPDTR